MICELRTKVDHCACLRRLTTLFFSFCISLSTKQLDYSNVHRIDIFYAGLANSNLADVSCPRWTRATSSLHTCRPAMGPSTRAPCYSPERGSLHIISKSISTLPRERVLASPLTRPRRKTCPTPLQSRSSNCQGSSNFRLHSLSSRVCLSPCCARIPGSFWPQPLVLRLHEIFLIPFL